jgi:HTH-type transcriptional regulator, transcriptional repressor of NAD biosynthesis genes
VSPAHGRALVIGKFYPPHQGHVRLIEEAMKLAQETIVLVYGNQYQHISTTDRVGWLKTATAKTLNTLNDGGDRRTVKIEPVLTDIYDDYVNANVWTAHDHILQVKLQTLGIRNEGIDLIVSSEAYGQEMAEKYFTNAAYHVVDMAREVVPISGTACRDDLFGNWHFLPEAVREGLIPRIIVTGAESTGTTTLALALAEHYGARYVPEYGRQYTEEWLAAREAINPSEVVEDLVWNHDDFERIATRQTMLENNAAKQLEGYPLVIADTDALSTAIWEFRYLGDGRPPVTLSGLPRRDLYFVTDHVGVEFEPDPIRDGELVRPEMTRWFERALTEAGHSWALLTGSHEERMTMATKMVDRVIAERLDFS